MINAQRVGAIVERELRKFIRTPLVLIMTIMMPLIQLAVQGNAFGGRVTGMTIAVVDQDGGPAARRVRDALYTLQSNGDMVRPVSYATEQEAADDVRHGRVNGAIVLPAHFSRRVYAGDEPRVGLLIDNTDNFVHAALRGLTTGAVQRAIRERPTSRLASTVALDEVELYPYVPYLRYLLPGVIALGLFTSVMIGGAIIYLDDKQRGVHEGYLVTPITKIELLLAFGIAGTIKASAGGVLIAVVGSLGAGMTEILQPARLAALVLLVVLTSFAFMAMTSCLVSRMSNPIMPRALFGMLNTLLYFPSGAIYPVQALPGWLRPLAAIDPFTYTVHALRVLLLKGASLTVMVPDLLFLTGFAVVMFAGAVLLFRRTL
jgi:ABC-2 type transport system permease protein